MSNHASVMLHVDKDLGDMTIDALVGELRRLPGVHQAQLGAGPASHHLILVDYDSETVNAYELLWHFTGQGFEAQLVGL